MTTHSLDALSDVQLLDATRALLHRSASLEADLLLHLAEVDERRLYAQRACSSMFAYCTEELGMSEDVTCNPQDPTHPPSGQLGRNVI